MKIVLTGANGYIGKNLDYSLGIDCDRVLTIGRRGCKYACQLNGDPEDIPHFKDAKAVVHCAANPDPTDKMSLYDNLRMTENLLRRYGPTIEYFIFISSLKVYGNWLYEEPRTGTYYVKPREDYTCLPVCQYGLSKLTCEHLVRMYAQQYGFTPVIYRLGPVVGDDMGGCRHGILHDFEIQAQKYQGGGFKVRGNYPGSTKPYTHIKDVMSAIDLFPDLNGTYNLCANDEATDEQLAWLVKRKYNIQDETIFTREEWPMNTPVMRGDAWKLRAAGWQPQCTTSEMAIQHALHF